MAEPVLKYTQEDIDNILEKKMESFKLKMEKTHINLNDYKQLEKEVLGFKKSMKEDTIKKEFLKNNGNIKHFEDFMKINDELYDIDEKELTKSIKEISKKRDWAFNLDKALQYNEEEVFNDLLPPKTEFYPGTFIKKE